MENEISNNVMISVIVPVYNVEDYLEECCDSIINQTYKNLEVLLIDDGSTDNSGMICDKLGEKYSCVRVFHKSNKGLASARNFGIEHAQGDYLGFVDSDDWIYRDMYSSMMDVAIRHSADIVCCNFDLQIDDKIVKRGGSGMEVLMQNEAVVNLMFPQYYQFYAPNKIFRRSIFRDINFPIGRHFEDIPTIYRLFLNSDKVYFIHKSGYVYRQRKESITNSGFNPKSYEVIESINYVLQDSKSRFPMDQSELYVGYLRYYISFLDKAIIGRSVDLKAYERQVSLLVSEHKKDIITSAKLSFPRKIQFLCCGYTPVVYECITRIRHKLRKI